MGCDIHLVLEKRSGSRWVAIDTFRFHHDAYRKKGDLGYAWPVATNRNYTRFARLAGVRGEGPEAKGLPPDASETTTYLSEDYGEDGHSHSYMPVSEAAKIFAETERWREDETEESFSRKYPESFFFNVEPRQDESIDDFRLVFWFDN